MKKNIYWKLFASTFFLSAFTFGGGYVIISLMKKKFADVLGWIKEEEMLDIAAMAQTAPGAVAVNAAVLLGKRVAGVPGVLIAVFATILPPFITISVISFFYEAFQTNPVVAAVLKGMQSGIAAVVIDVVFGLGKNIVCRKQIFSIIVMSAAFIATFFLKVNTAIIIVVCGLAGSLFYLLKGKDKEEQERAAV